MVNRFLVSCVVMAGAIGAVAPVAAQDWTAPVDAGEALRISGGFGIVYLHANEFVYSGGSTLSQLIWQSAAPVAEVTLAGTTGNGFYVQAHAEGALGGIGYMEDFDWVAPYATGTGPDDWSHRSQHPDTRLDHYLRANLRGGQRLLGDQASGVGLHAEIGVTDVQWTAYGGSFVYSDGGYRNWTGTIPAGLAGITYRQTFPVVMGGVDFKTEMGNFTLSGEAQGGVTLFAKTVDDHWLRDLRFDDYFYPAPVFAAKLKGGYKISPDAELFMSASGQKIFTGVGDTVVTDTITDATTSFGGAAGSDLLSLSAKAGFGGRF